MGNYKCIGMIAVVVFAFVGVTKGESEWAVKALANSPANEIVPAWSPDGQQVAFVSDESGVDHIYIIDSDGTDKWQVSAGSYPCFHATNGAVSWSNDCEYILYEQKSQATTWPRDIFKCKLTSDRHAVEERWNLTQAPVTTLSRHWQDPRFSPDGNWITASKVSNGWPRLHIISNRNADANEGDWSPLGQGTMSELGVWKLDSSLVAYAHHSNAFDNNHSDIWIVDPTNTNDTKILDRSETGMHLEALAWSPDGSSLAFASKPYNSESTYLGLVTPVEPENQIQILAEDEAVFARQAYSFGADLFSLGGDLVVYTQKEGDVWNIWTVDTSDPNKKRRVVSSYGDDQYAMFSDNGSIVFQTNRAGNWDIYVAKQLEILSPNGGESWVSGTTQDIEWDTAVDANIAEVKIEYSDSNGQSWNLIDSNTTSDGQYEWLVPEVTSNQCLVRICDLSDANISDVSDDVFTIFQCLGPVPGDLNEDCYTNGKDLAILAAHWLRCGNPLDPACGLVAYWNCDEGGGNTAYDQSGNGNDGTLINVFHVPSMNTNMGNAYDFNGNNSQVVVQDSASLQLNTFTILCWIKSRPNYWRVGVVTKYPEFEPYTGYSIRLVYDKPQLSLNRVIEGIRYTQNVIADTNVADGVWHHVVGVYDGQKAQIYIDGILEAEESYSDGFDNNNAPLRLGKFLYPYADGHGNLPPVLNGSLDEIRIYNKSLTSTEIKYLYKTQE